MNRFAPYVLAALRIMSALLFIAHGTQKLFGFPAPPPWGLSGTFTLTWFAALLEIGGGALLVLGLFTRPVAFVLSGLMAFAYFLSHAPKSFYPVLNGGDGAVLFCFVFLYLVFSGPGALALDKR
nr:DoxX family protein [Roseomonas sp. GC11]